METRMIEFDSKLGSPMAERTWEGLSAPDEQAEPEETQKRVFIQFNDESGNLKKAEVIFEKNN